MARVEFIADGREYIAVREAGDPSPGWYFLVKTLGRNQVATRVMPPGACSPADLLPPGVDRTDSTAIFEALDAFYLRGKEGAAVSRLMTREEYAAAKVARERAAKQKAYSAAFPTDPLGTLQAAPRDAALLGPASWTHYSLGTPVTGGGALAEERLQGAVAAAIAATDPGEEWDANDMLAWHGLVAEIQRSDFLSEPALLQKLAAAPARVVASPAARAALAELLAAHEKRDVMYVGLFASLLSRFKPASEGGRAGAGTEQVEAAGAGGRALDATGDDIALGRLVADFQSFYTPVLGQRLLDVGEGDNAEAKAKVERILRGITSSRTWRTAVASLLASETGQSGQRALDDPFLHRFVHTAATGDAAQRAELAGSPVLAGDIPFALRLAVDALVAAAGSAQAEGGQSFSDAARAVLAPALATELTALLASDVAHAVVGSLAKDAEGGLQEGADPTALFAALRVGRVRQEAGFALAARVHASGHAGLAVSPADAHALRLAAGADGKAGPYEAILRLRSLALTFMTAQRGALEFFPEEGAELGSLDASSGAAAMAAASIAAVRPDERPADAGSGLGLRTGEDSVAGLDLVGAALEGRAVKARAVRCIGKEAVRTIARALMELQPFQLDSATRDQYAARRAELLASLEGDMDEEARATAAEEASALGTHLLAHSFAVRILRLPDVLILLLHAAFHPGVVVDDAAAEAAGATPVSELLAVSLAFAASVAGVEAGQRRDAVEAGTLAGASALPLGDSSLVLPLLSMPLSSGSAAYLLPARPGEEAGPALDEGGAVGALARVLHDLSRSCKPGAPLQQLLPLSFASTISAAGMNADETLAREEAGLFLRGAAHPLAAAGVLHWAHHMMLSPALHEDARVLKLAPVYGRMAVGLAERFPLLAPNALALLRSCLQLVPPFTDALSLAPCRDTVAGLIADLATGSGYILPTLAFATTSVSSGSWEVAVARVFLSRLVPRLATTPSPTAPPSFSMPLSLALARFIHAFQQRSAALAKAMGGKTESILLPREPGLQEAFAVLIGDVSRWLRGTSSKADLASLSAEQRELFRLLDAIKAVGERERKY